MFDPAACLRLPDVARALVGDEPTMVACQAGPHGFAGGGVEVSWREGQGRGEIRISSRQPVSEVWVGWDHPVGDVLILGDAWERAYGDLAWRRPDFDALLPWYFLACEAGSGRSAGIGVEVRPGALCAWKVGPTRVWLRLDVRNGGAPVVLGSRELLAASVVGTAGEEGPYLVQVELCRLMCQDPRPDVGPVVGCNDWYYSYGHSSPETILRDAEFLSDLAGPHRVRPFAVVDAGWSPGGVSPGGPFAESLPHFGKMDDLADRLAKLGARPGIWIRPTALSKVEDPKRLRAGPHPSKEKPLDLTREDNVETVREEVARTVEWGYQLVKYDFSTFDLFGRFGPAMATTMTDPGWHFQDRSVTNAEIARRLYETVAAAAGGAVVLGCNTLGHIAAGLVDVQRVGDDTSGRSWEITRRMGVNGLAFRAAQHGAFFSVDADCVPCTETTPWEKNRQFLDLVARSGTALFISVDPSARTPAIDQDLRAAVALALDGGAQGGTEPLDWLSTTTPSSWRFGATRHEYDWG